jgi:hypothetical protein
VVQLKYLSTRLVMAAQIAMLFYKPQVPPANQAAKSMVHLI